MRDLLEQWGLPATLIVTSVVLGALRIAGMTHPAYQAIAHLFVGGLFGAFLSTLIDGVEDYGLLALAILLSVLELGAAVVTRLT